MGLLGVVTSLAPRHISRIRIPDAPPYNGESRWAGLGPGRLDE